MIEENDGETFMLDNKPSLDEDNQNIEVSYGIESTIKLSNIKRGGSINELAEATKVKTLPGTRFRSLSENITSCTIFKFLENKTLM